MENTAESQIVQFSPESPKGIAALDPSMEGVTIRRDAPIKLYGFTEYFQGFEKVQAVRDLFGDKTRKVLEDLKVEFFSSRWGYMGVSEEDGHLKVSTYHLRNGDERELYLDVIHELVHVRQYMDGKEFFPEGIKYPDLPTEIEAYQVTIGEARRIGMKEEEILEYLRVPWMDDEDYEKLLVNLGIRIVASSD